MQHFSFTTSNIENIFICLLAMCISSLERCLFRSFVHFLNWVKLPFYNWIVRPFIHSIGKFLIRYTLIYMIHASMSSLFTFLRVSFEPQRFLTLMKSNLNSLFKNQVELWWILFFFSSIYNLYLLICLYLCYLLSRYLEKFKASCKIFLGYLLSSLKSTYWG